MNFSIKTKLILISTSTIILVILVLSSFFLQRERRLVRENIINQTRVTVDRLGATVSGAWFSTERDLTLVETMGSFKQIPHLIYVFVQDNEGNVVAATSGKSIDLKRTQLRQKYLKSTPQSLQRKYDQYQNKKEPLISDRRIEGSNLLDFYLPVYHHIRQNEPVAQIRLGISTAEIDEKTRETTITILTIAAVLILVGIALGFVQGWYFSTPLLKLANHSASLGQGDFHVRIDMQRKDEYGLLAASFNSMAQNLEDSEKMKLEKTRMDEQISLAKEIQESLNPSRFYNKAGLEVKGYTKAAKGIGGDYFDFVDMDDDHTAVLVSDVSGKDIPASLIMIMIRTVLTTLLKTNIPLSPALIMNSINRIIASDFAMDKFATMLLLMINRKTGDLYFTNAGHNPVLLYRSELGQCTHIPLEGLPIGVDEDSEYTMGHTSMKPGDISVLYSDGVTEAWNENKEEYQKHRVIKIMTDLSDKNAEQICDDIITDIWNFMGEAMQHDDTTLVVVKKTPFEEG